MPDDKVAPAPVSAPAVKPTETKKKELSHEEKRHAAIVSGANAAIKKIRLIAAKARVERLSYADAAVKFEKDHAAAKEEAAANHQKHVGDFYASRK